MQVQKDILGCDLKNGQFSWNQSRFKTWSSHFFFLNTSGFKPTFSDIDGIFFLQLGFNPQKRLFFGLISP